MLSASGMLLPVWASAAPLLTTTALKSMATPMPGHHELDENKIQHNLVVKINLPEGTQYPSTYASLSLGGGPGLRPLLEEDCFSTSWLMLAGFPPANSWSAADHLLACFQADRKGLIGKLCHSHGAGITVSP